MDSSKESEFLNSECKRITDKIKAAQARGRMGGVVKRGEEIKAQKALEDAD